MKMAGMNKTTEHDGDGGVAGDSKSKAGRDRRSMLSIMRSRAYIYELIRRRGAPSVNALKEIIYPTYDPKNPRSKGTSSVPDLDKHMRGERAVTNHMLNLASQIPVQATARRVFEIGPEEDQGNVPLWAIFEDRFEEFDEIIEAGLRLSKPGSNLGLSRADRVALLFLPADQWHRLRTTSGVAAGPNLAQQAYDAGYFIADVRRLAAAIAFWRLCLSGADEWGPVETLLDWLITGPYAEVVANLGISEEMRDLLRMVAEDHHIQQGNVAAAARALTRFGTNGKRADRFG
ncbi:MULTISPECIES: hypothetical protein [Burkholderia cepacia complex]|uniref:hypothetical protein n=1 Tax=Burkholderia cepacia complex TaxID=87882 RepID=UPI000B15960E|nr:MULTISPECIES: hypothetical protein [Burkholderia cepacia complex]